MHFIVTSEGMGNEGAVTLTFMWNEMKGKSNISSLHHKYADGKLHPDCVAQFGLYLGCLCSQIDNYYRKKVRDRIDVISLSEHYCMWTFEK